MRQVIVVGAGISGLATAWFLHRKHVPVVVLEADDQPGGTVRTIERDGFLIDAGPTSTLSRGGALDQLIADMGLEAEVVEADRRAPRYIVKDDKLVPLPMGLGAFLRTPLFSARAKLRLLAEPFQGRAAVEESIAQFVRRRIGQEFLDWAVDPFVSGVYAGDPEELSVQAAIPRLHALEAEHGSLFVGALARMFRGDRGGAQPRGRLISFRDGMQSLPRAIALRLGSALQLNTPVTSIERTSNETWLLRTPSKQYIASDVVLALPAQRAADLLRTNAPAIATELDAIHYPPVASVALGLVRAQITHPLDGFGALLPRRLGRETLGVIFSSTLFPGRAPSGQVLLTAFIGGARNPAVAGCEESAIVQRVLADLRPLLGIRGDPIFQFVTLWSQAIPQYVVGHNARVARIDAALARFPGLYLRANWCDGVSLGDSVANAERLTQRLVSDKRAKPTLPVGV